ncbi:MAG: hypothetical protein ACLFWL_13185 [Candidatus Brocadiia bacterium]
MGILCLLVGMGAGAYWGVTHVKKQQRLREQEVQNAPVDWVEEARKEMRAGNLKQAISCYQRVLNCEPSRRKIFVEAENELRAARRVLEMSQELQAADQNNGGTSETGHWETPGANKQ